MPEHIQHTVSVCNQRLYLLCQLKGQNLPVECLDRIFDAIVISKLICALPSGFGYISVEQLNIIRKLFVKAHRWGLTENSYNADELFAFRDQQLFKAVDHFNHCLQHLLPPVKKVCYKLRTPSYELIVHKLKQTRYSYLVRMVFENLPV